MPDNMVPHSPNHQPQFDTSAVLTSGSPSVLSKEIHDDNNDRSLFGLIGKLFQWTPPIWLEKVVISAATPVLIWLVTFLLVKEEGLPGGQLFALLVLMFLGIATGFALELIKFPPLLGMLAVGMAMRNIPGFQLCQNLNSELSSYLRQLALIVILIRAGLGLDPVALAKLSGVVIRLAFGPCIVEALALGICTHFLLDFPWAWGFLLGFVIAAVSPAVTVPCLLSLRDRGYGVAKGIPTIVIAAASIDDILAISAFGVTLGFAIAQQESITMTLIQGPIEVILGLSFGLVWGLGCGIFQSRSEAVVQTGKDESTLFRLLFIFGGGIISVFGFQYVGYPGSGALGCLTAAFVASVLWRKKGVLKDNDNLNWAFQKLWFIFQPLLFGLIGCEIDLLNLNPNVILMGLLCLVIALSLRIVTSFYMVARAGLTLKERLFISLAWLPKATVQAAIGPVAYDLARQQKAGPVAEELGFQVLTIAVLSILITAPAGAVAIMLGGPKLLSRGDDDGEEEDENCSEDEASGGYGENRIGDLKPDIENYLTGNSPKIGRAEGTLDSIMLDDDDHHHHQELGNNRTGASQDINIQMALVNKSISAGQR